MFEYHKAFHIKKLEHTNIEGAESYFRGNLRKLKGKERHLYLKGGSYFL